jgi:hypothetical protein
VLDPVFLEPFDSLDYGISIEYFDYGAIEYVPRRSLAVEILATVCKITVDENCKMIGQCTAVSN